MTKTELEKKIMETLDASVDEWATRDNRGRLHVWLEKIANVLINAGLRFDDDGKKQCDDKPNERDASDELFNIAMFCAKHAAPPKVRDGVEAVQREYAETLVKSWRAQGRRSSEREIQDVFAYLLDGAIEREDDGGFVTVTILKSKFDTLKKDYVKGIDGRKSDETN